MKNIKVLLIGAVFICALLSANAQTISINRSDADSSHASFVTATKLFGLDIHTDGIDSCNGVTFELRYTLPEYIKYSGYSVEKLGRNASSVVITSIDSLTGEGVIYAGILTGDSIGAAGYSNPRVIHLEFVVSQAAPDSTETVFTFTSAQAVVTRSDTVGTILELTSSPISYRIHSFINVWPGDADNNGNVDSRDISRIGLFLDYGMPGNTMRSFRRDPASTIWYAQKVLAWDSVEVTYADCDGNGTVTINDMLVVPLNFNKIHQKALNSQEEIESIATNTNEVVYPAGAIRIPVYMDASIPLLGTTGRLNINQDDNGCKILGLEQGSLFDRGFFFFRQVDNSGTFEYAAGATGRQAVENNGKKPVCYIVLDKSPENVSFQPFVEEATGMDENGFYFPIKGALSVENHVVDNYTGITAIGGKLRFRVENNIRFDQNMQLFDIRGRQVYPVSLSISGDGDVNADVSNLDRGVYFLNIKGEKPYKFNICE